MLLHLILLLVLSLDSATSDGMIYRSNGLRDPDAISDLDKRTPDFIEKFGYVAETHEVTTEDGYVLGLQRVAGRKHQGPRGLRPAVLIQHGISGASDNWLIVGNNSFPFLLFQSGYDVWLADSRGNSYSQKHVKFSPNDPEFWNFSFHEQALFDLSASIDYILATTGMRKLFYIGHSRGTTMGFALLSKRPQYNEKIALFVAYAPVAYLKHSKSPTLQSFFDNASSKELARIARSSRLFALPGKDSSMTFRRMVCGRGAPTQPLCTRLLFLFMGFDYELTDNELIPSVVSHFPDGGAIKEFLHYIQIAQSDKFQEYDYGTKRNMEVYGQTSPPLYDISKVTAPVSLHFGDNDFFVSYTDLDRLARQLPNLAGKHRIPFRKFNHMDFLIGTKADVLLYRPTIKFMGRFGS